VGVRHDLISELNLRGLLPCCVRFAPTGHPVNGNTGYRPAGSLWPGGTRTRWIPLRGFTGSFQLLLFQAFPNAICGELEVRPPGAPTTRASAIGRERGALDSHGRYTCVGDLARRVSTSQWGVSGCNGRD